MAFNMSGRRDSNPRPPAPKAGALTGLRYAPCISLMRCKGRHNFETDKQNDSFFYKKAFCLPF